MKRYNKQWHLGTTTPTRLASSNSLSVCRLTLLPFSCSVTRFGVFWPIGQNFKSLAIIWGLIQSLAQKIAHALANFLCHWANFYCCKWPKIVPIIYPSGHSVLVSLSPLSRWNVSYENVDRGRWGIGSIWFRVIYSRINPIFRLVFTHCLAFWSRKVREGGSLKTEKRRDDSIRAYSRNSSSPNEIFRFPVAKNVFWNLTHPVVQMFSYEAFVEFILLWTGFGNATNKRTNERTEEREREEEEEEPRDTIAFFHSHISIEIGRRIGYERA